MRRTLIVGWCLLALLSVGCNKDARSGNDGPAPSPSVKPAVVSSSDQVVKISSVPVNISLNAAVDTVLTLSISPGFHVNANPATFSYLIATELTPGKVDGITVGKPAYPPGIKKKFQFAEEPLAVYEGEISIKLNLHAEKTAATGARSLPVTLRVQACDEEKCFPPATVNATIPVDVK